MRLYLFLLFNSFLWTCSNQHTASTARHYKQTPDTNRKVMICKTARGFQLYRNGEPYYIKGASGAQQLEWIKKAGGNSVRVYTTDGLDTLLDRAMALDLSVIVDLYVGRPMEGFDYRDTAAVAAQKERIKNTVLSYKDHPALLLWAVGNEPDNGVDDVQDLWPAVNDLIRMIHQIDPDHPATVPVYPGSVETVLRMCPDIDLIAINSFSNLPVFVQEFSKDIPYIVSEYGPDGPWEGDNLSYWLAPVEPAFDEKGRIVRERHALLRADSTRCLGSYVFYWGQKQEYTPTWFSFFTENGCKTPLVDLMFDLWSSRQPENCAPVLRAMTLSGTAPDANFNLHAGKTCKVSVKGSDADGDALRYHWELIPDGPFDAFIPGNPRQEIRPRAIDLVLHGNGGPEVQFEVPDRPGPYRIYVHVEDGAGGGCSANLPVFIVNERLR